MPQDGSTTFLGGQDASKDAALVAPQSYYSGVNLNIQKGVLSPRWGYTRLLLEFQQGGVTLPNFTIRSYEEIFRTGRFQALIPYVVGTDYYLIIVVSGLIFLFNQNTNLITIIPIAGGSLLSGSSPRLNWCAAGKYIVIFDYPAYPVIIENLAARRADPNLDEVPISTIGAYNQNRIFVANAGNAYTAGDPTGSLAAPDAPITFKEIEQSGSNFFGQVFQLPTSYPNDTITAMAFLQFTDTSTGIGPLLIGTKRQTFSVLSQIPRAQWEANQFATCILFDAGIAGNRAGTNVNSDYFFMGGDCQVRPLSMSRSEQGKWSKVPISREVQNWLIFSDPSLVSYAALSYFRNKIFITANPIRVPALDLDGTPIIDVAHGGFAVLELDSISNMQTQSPPAWLGLWTGVRPMDMCNNNDKCFVISKDSSAINHLYTITPEKTYDLIDGTVRKVRSRVYTREYDFQSPFQNKEVNNINFNLNNVKGDFTLDIKYKPAQSAKFIDWRTFVHQAPWRACAMPTDCELNGFAGHSFRDLNLGAPSLENECDIVTQDNYSLFKKLQLKLTITGIYWEIKDFLIDATVRPQNTTESVCEPYPIVAVCQECNDDWNVEKENLCQTEL